MGKKTDWIENVFETALFNVRFITIMAVIGSVVASVVMFIKGTMLVVRGVSVFLEQITNFHGGAEHGVDALVPILVTSVDNYLFATVLLIFSMGLYELFVSKIDPASRTSESPQNSLRLNCQFVSWKVPHVSICAVIS